MPAPDVQRLTDSQSPTFGTPIPSRVSQSTPSAPLGPTHQIHSSNLPFGPPLEQAQPPARSVGALEPEPARGESATQDQATTADNLTAAPEAASPETALLVGRHLHELVVARNPWVSASPVTVDGPVHLPVPVEVQREGLLSATGSPLSRDLSLPQMPFQPGASSNPEVSRSAARPASTVVRSSNSQVQRLVDRDPNNLGPPLPVATPAQRLTFAPSAGQGSRPSPLSLPQRVVFSAPSVASPTAEDAISAASPSPPEEDPVTRPTISVQRADDGQAEPPSAAAAAAGPTAAQEPGNASGAGAAHGGEDIDDLSRRIYDRIRDRLKAELYLDRERAGQLSDLTV